MYTNIYYIYRTPDKGDECYEPYWLRVGQEYQTEPKAFAAGFVELVKKCECMYGTRYVYIWIMSISHPVMYVSGNTYIFIKYVIELIVLLAKFALYIYMYLHYV